MPSTAESVNIFRYAKFEVSALCHLASKLRGGQSCFCDISQVPASGSFNWAILISFNDGVEWVLRSPRTCGAIMREETNLLLLASEAATLKYIKANSKIPVPEVFAYSCSRDNDVGIPYIIMSKAHGSPLQSMWNALELHDEPDITQGKKAKIIFQLGVITEKLSRLRFDQAGSLFEEDGEFHIKTCLSRGMVLHNRTAIDDLPRGPFKTEMAYYQAQISAFLEHVKYLPLSHHCFFAPIPAPSEYDDNAEFQKVSDWWSDFVTVQSKIDGSDNRVDYVIAGEILSETITKCTRELSDVLNGSERRFAIHHPDLNVNNIFVDEDLNITCIIDWAFCSAVPLSMLLTAPGLPQSRHEIDASLLAVFENGFRHALEENSQYQDIGTEKALCFMLSHSRSMWLFSRIITLDSTTDYHLCEALWGLVRSCNQDMLEFFRSKESSKTYISLHSELKEDDPPTEKVSKSEREYFRDDAWKLAVSRKLTLVSQWSSRYQEPQAHGIRSNGNVFVADKRLWAWIGNCLKP